MRFAIGDIANGIETSREIIEADNEISALKMLIESANLYCKQIIEIECPACGKQFELGTGSEISPDFCSNICGCEHSQQILS